MKAFLSIAFLLILLFNLFGFYGAFLLNRQEVRREMQEAKIRSLDDIQVLTMSKEEFKEIVWIEKEKEFRMNGRLFDVEEIEIAENHVKLYVEEDVKETDLVDSFTSTVSQHRDEHGKHAPLKNLLNNFLKEFTWEQSKDILFSDGPVQVYFPDKKMTYSSFISDRQTPPPDLIFS